MVASQEQGGFFGTNLDRPLPVIPLLASLMVLAACSMGNADLSRIDQSQVVAEAEWKAAVREEREGLSFRQFQPSKDGSPRKAVFLDFSSGIGLWAQYSKDGYAVNEWEIYADSYSIDGQAGDTIFTVFFDNPSSTQEFPDPCDGCIEIEQFSISIRNVFSSDKIAFRFNDPERVLPLPFPVFRSWTKFLEDEHFDSPILRAGPLRISQVFAAWENTLAGRFGGKWQIAKKGVAIPQGPRPLNDFEGPHTSNRAAGASPKSKKHSGSYFLSGSFAHCASLFSGDVISSTEV